MGIRNNRFYRQLSLSKGKLWWLRSRLTNPSLHHQAHAFLQENQDRLFFILGTGRSGTQLISDLLNSTEKALVFHEPNFREDVATLDILRREGDRAIQYWREFRSTEIYRRWSKTNKQLYGEVNGTIRYQVPAIQHFYPKAKLLLLSRDGRGVVRSVMGWPQFYGEDSKGAYALTPLYGDPYFESWPSMSRFERVCWAWRETNEYLSGLIPEDGWIQLEQIIKEYDYFSEKIFANVGLTVPHEKWNEVVSKKSPNASRSYDFPDWKDWTSEQKASFQKICGETMVKLGYPI